MASPPPFGFRRARPRLVIFDCDGVLFDSREANRAFYNQLLSGLGKPLLTEEGLNYVHMHTVFEAVDYLFPEVRERLAAHAYRKKIDPWRFIRLMVPESGIESFLTFLRPLVKTAISTNRPTTIRDVLEFHRLAGYFDLVVSALDVTRPKPDPESLIKIMDYFEIRPREALYVGDSEVDALASRQAAIPLVAYKNAALEAELHVESFDELRNHLVQFEGFPGRGDKKSSGAGL
jgi:phosphoglycolate phosphatase